MGGVFKGTKFVIYKDRRTGRDRDMSLGDWEAAKRDPNRKRDVENWELVRIIDMEQDVVPVVKEGGIEHVEVEEDELECPLCGHTAKDDDDLKKHKKAKHA